MVARDARHVRSGERRVLSGLGRQRDLRDGMIETLRAMEAGDLFDGMHLFTAQGTLVSRERTSGGRWNPHMPGGLARRAEELLTAAWTLRTAVEHGRLMEQGRQALAVIPDRDIDMCRDLLRAAGQDATGRPVDLRGTALGAATEVVARSIGPAAPSAALSRRRATRRTAQGREQERQGRERGEGPGTSSVVPATFRSARAARNHPGLELAGGKG
jgi:hypothetical protein